MQVPVAARSKGAHTRTSLARESASGSLTREPGSDIYVYIQVSHYYQTRQFFNNFITNEDIAQQLGALQTHSSSFLTYELTAGQISLKYIH
jgi:hypothetical protein